jgi:hypothetical protein
MSNSKTISDTEENDRPNENSVKTRCQPMCHQSSTMKTEMSGIVDPQITFVRGEIHLFSIEINIRCVDQQQAWITTSINRTQTIFPMFDNATVLKCFCQQ